MPVDLIGEAAEVALEAVEAGVKAKNRGCFVLALVIGVAIVGIAVYLTQP